ncbi:hypothetical protein BC830DRAFT_1093404 [Chytriomyces sp. MP71]|nr:hypothetical protein BC830DRAFT_1093404 [Chytriomyces sp. MP71]
MSKQQPLRTPMGRLAKASKQSQAVADTRDIRTLFAAPLPHRSGATPTDANEGLPCPATSAIAVSVKPAITRHRALSLSFSNMGMKAIIGFSSSLHVNAPIAHRDIQHADMISYGKKDDYLVLQDQDLEVRVSFVRTLSGISGNHSTIRHAVLLLKMMWKIFNALWMLMAIRTTRR